MKSIRIRVLYIVALMVASSLMMGGCALDDGDTAPAPDPEPRSASQMILNDDFGDPVFGTECDPDTDPYQCECPPQSEMNRGDRCTFASIHYDLETFEDPSQVDTSQFMVTDYDQSEGRWTVLVDLRDYNGGGLIPQGDGTWSSIEELQNYIADLTGVSPDPQQKRLFNFDFIQLGYSTGVVDEVGITNGMNHFLLDVITDENGHLTIDGQTYNLPDLLDDSTINIPPEFTINNPRTGDECVFNGASGGGKTVTARSCTELQMANIDPGNTDLGIYRFESRIWDLRVNDVGTTRDEHCVINGIYNCRVRTIHRDGDMRLDHDQFIEDGDLIEQVRDLVVREKPVTALIVDTDRHWDSDDTPIDGICSLGTTVRNERYEIPLDTAAGAVPASCDVE